MEMAELLCVAEVSLIAALGMCCLRHTNTISACPSSTFVTAFQYGPVLSIERLVQAFWWSHFRSLPVEARMFHTPAIPLLIRYRLDLP